MHHLTRLVFAMYRVVVSIYAVATRSVWRPALPALRVSDPQLACVVLGTGPSLQETIAKHRTFFQGKRTMGVNHIAQSPLFAELRPEYYVMFDPAFWSEPNTERKRALALETCTCLRERVSWGMTLFMPMAAKTGKFAVELPGLNSNIRICFVNSTPIACAKTIRFFLYRRNLAMCPIETVLNAALFIATNLGYRKIYLAGADSTFHEEISLGRDNLVYHKSSHFYDTEAETLVPLFADAAKTKPIRMHEYFLSTSRVFSSYWEIGEYAQHAGTTILNISPRTWIDAFERHEPA